jgi:hypothetical protein
MNHVCCLPRSRSSIRTYTSIYGFCACWNIVQPGSRCERKARFRKGQRVDTDKTSDNRRNENRSKRCNGISPANTGTTNWVLGDWTENGSSTSRYVPYYYYFFFLRLWKRSLSLPLPSYSIELADVTSTDARCALYACFRFLSYAVVESTHDMWTNDAPSVKYTFPYFPIMTTLKNHKCKCEMY